MQANTLKIETPLLHDLHRLKPKSLSFSTYVKKLLEESIQKEKIANATREYSLFLQKNPEEEKWLDEWDKLDLSTPPKAKEKKGKK